MDVVEIKKSLHEQNTRVELFSIKEGVGYYTTTIKDGNNEPYMVIFEIPVDDMSEGSVIPIYTDTRVLNKYIKNAYCKLKPHITNKY